MGMADACTIYLFLAAADPSAAFVHYCISWNYLHQLETAFQELSIPRDYLHKLVVDAGVLAEKGIPVLKIEQKLGDLVAVPPGTIHWGYCTVPYM